VDELALRQAALAVLEKNRRSALDRDGAPIHFSCPSPSSYPFQWFWDSCFHAIALGTLRPEWAAQELEALVASQTEEGFIPHVTFHGGARPSYWAYAQGTGWRPTHSAMIQPPVLGLALYRVVSLTEDWGLAERLLPAVDSYHDWLLRERDHDSDGLISIITPYESGLDHTPQYDRVMGDRGVMGTTLTPRLRLLDLGNKRRGFRLAENVRQSRFHAEDVLVNTFFAVSLLAVAKLRRQMGEADAAARAEALGNRVREGLLDHCWNTESGQFFSLYGSDEVPLRTPTIEGLVPLALPGLPDPVVAALGKRLLSDDFWTLYPIPSVAITDPSFEAGQAYRLRSPLIWRGGTWINTNWLIHLGLLRYGFHREAEVLAERSMQLVTGAGFREFYNPFTGEGYGARGFGWSTLVVDMLPNQREGRVWP
jgi:glycogen debranching enzyme